MDDAISAAALACGVGPSAVRAALGSGRVREVADLLGLPHAELKQRVADLVASGVERDRAIAMLVLAA